MRRGLRHLLWAAGTVTAATAPLGLGAQQTVLKACWVSGGSGVIYRIDTVGAPTACTKSTHRQIEWVIGTTPSGGGALVVPLNIQASTTAHLVNVTQTGAGGAMRLESAGTLSTLNVTNTAPAPSTSPAIFAQGTGASYTINSTALSATGGSILAVSQGTSPTISARNTGGGAVASFTNQGTGGGISVANNSTTASAGHFENRATGNGFALTADSWGTYPTAQFGKSAGNAPALRLFGSGDIIGSTSGTALQVTNNGTGGGIHVTNSSTTGSTAHFENKATGNGFALTADSWGTFPTAQFGKSAGTEPALRTFGWAHFIAKANQQALSVAGRADFNNNNTDVTNLSVFSNSTANVSAVNINARATAPALAVATSGSGGAISGASNGTGATAYFQNDYTGNAFTILASGRGTYPTAQFSNSASGGVALRTFGNADIQGNFFVNGNTGASGTKSAVVKTSSGDREFYTEEATEVWFADYGSARLRGASVWVPLDPTFGETVIADSTYHVFLQPYGEAALYVSRRTPTGFEVRASGPGASAADVEFSFRLVAKRRGFADRRLRLHPSPLTTPALWPETTPTTPEARP